MSRPAIIYNRNLVRLFFVISLTLLVGVSLTTALPSTANAYEV